MEKLMALLALIACAAAGVGVATGRDPSVITVSVMLGAAVLAGIGYMRSN